MRTRLIIGNWKMYKTAEEAVALVRELKGLLPGDREVEVVVCPPFTALPAVARELEGSRLGLGAQNMHWEKQGAFTGEISPVMLKCAGCTYVLAGHSERRVLFGESDERVRMKVRAAFDSGITPVLCVGETLEERDVGQTEQVVGGQLREGLRDLSVENVSRLVVAYEPVWAIGTGRPATGEDANAVAGFIRKMVSVLWGEGAARAVRVLYGGSVRPDNAAAFLHQPEIDGALVGGASMDARSFVGIVEAVR